MSLERELAAIDADLRAARARRDLLDAQLRDTPRDSRRTIDETGQIVMGGADRLAAAQQELVAALAKYSEDHPDVRRLRREIATLSDGSRRRPAGAADEPGLSSSSSRQSNCGSHRNPGTFGAPRRDLEPALQRCKARSRFRRGSRNSTRSSCATTRSSSRSMSRCARSRRSAELRSKAAGSSATETYVLINPARIPDRPDRAGSRRADVPRDRACDRAPASARLSS